MGNFKPTMLRISGISLVVTLTPSLIPTFTVGDDDRRYIAGELYKMLPADISRRLEMPKDGVSFYEQGDNYVRFVVREIPEPKEMTGPWDVGGYLQTLIDKLRPLEEAYAEGGMKASLCIHVAGPQFDEVPWWFVFAILQFQPTVEPEQLFQLESHTIGVPR